MGNQQDVIYITPSTTTRWLPNPKNFGTVKGQSTPLTNIGKPRVSRIDLNFAGEVQSEIQQNIIDLFGEEHTSAAGTIKMFGEDQLKQNILSKIPRIQQHIINEDFDYNYMAKRLQCRESSGQH